MADYHPSLAPMPFDVNHDAMNIGIRWAKWIARFDNFLVATNITSDERKTALLLHHVGEDAYDLYMSLPDSPGSTSITSSYEKAKQKFTSYFQPKVNVEFEIYNFRQAKQRTGEMLDQFYARLLKLAKFCSFHNIENEVKSQIIVGTNDSKLRQYALREQPNLDKLLAHGRTLETTSQQMSSMEQGHHHDVQQIKAFRASRNKSNTPCGSRAPPINKNCANCGNRWHSQGRQHCPARKVCCNSCGRKGHFAKVCLSSTRKRENPTNQQPAKSRTLRANALNTDEHLESAEELFQINLVSKQRTPSSVINVQGTSIPFTIDTGASVNVISMSTYRNLNNCPALAPTSTHIFPYNSKCKLPVAGTFTATLEHNGRTARALIFVIEGRAASLLSFDTATQLDLLQIANTLGSSNIHERYPALFSGVGKLKSQQIHLFQDTTIAPVAQRHRRLPFHLRTKVEEELKRLQDADIIEKVSSPTPWVSPIVVVPKPHNPDAIRLCVDMRCPNTCIKRVRHITPTLDDIILTLNGAKFFSKLDLKDGYHQLVLDEESRVLTTFSTHAGLFRYKRLNFGINAAAEVFQDTIRQVIGNVKGVINVSDDILISGTTESEHDEALEKVLQQLSEHGLTLNPHKCVFKASTVKFFGYIFSERGLSPDPQKVKAIVRLQAPQNVSEVRSLLGMFNYVAKFMPNLATKTQTIRSLLLKDTPWCWTIKHQKEFDALKSEIAKAHELVYFDPKKDIHLYVDAGPSGLGAILAQEANGQTSVVAYASRSLTNVEKRYSHIEKEMLAITWAVEHFHIYLYGAHFHLHTDHKPLVSICKNPRSLTSARLERLRLRIQCYEFDISHQPGTKNPADYLSRHTLAVTDLDQAKANLVEEHVNFVVSYSTPKAMHIEEVRNHTACDQTLQMIIAALEERALNLRHKDILRAYNPIWNELSVADGILLRGSKIVIPQSLQYKVVQIAHQGHLGIAKTKQLLRSKVWFPNMDKMVEEQVRSCFTCQVVTPTSRREPLIMSELPISPWHAVDMDFAGPYPNGKYLLILIDEYSRYPIVEILSSIDGETVISALQHIFADFGIPMVLKSDNGPPFNGDQFSRFAKEYAFKHHKVTPYWPEANGLAERTVKTLKKRILCARLEHKTLRQELNTFLLSYRATPHSTTHKPPFELMFNRSVRSFLPTTTKHETDQSLVETDRKNKLKQKTYADSRRKTRSSELEIGDTVIYKQAQKNKFTPPFNPNPLVVTNIAGSQITAEDAQNRVVRNASFFKKVEDASLSEKQPLESDISDVFSPDIISLSPTKQGVQPANSEEPVGEPPPVEIPTSSPSRRLQPSRSSRGQLPSKFKDYVLT